MPPHSASPHSVETSPGRACRRSCPAKGRRPLLDAQNSSCPSSVPTSGESCKATSPPATSPAAAPPSSSSSASSSNSAPCGRVCRSELRSRFQYSRAKLALRRHHAVLAGCQELDARPSLLGERQADHRRREKHELPRMIFGEIAAQLSLELVELLRVGAPYPTRSNDVDGFEHALDAVLVLQTERSDVELQRTHGADDELVADERPKQLRGALLAELRETFLQGLELERVLEHGTPTQLWRRVRNASEREAFALCEAVADVDSSMVVQPDDVARKSGRRLMPVRRHERNGITDPDLAPETRVMHAHPRLVGSGADPQEGDAIAVPGLHILLDLEHESSECRLRGADAPRHRFSRRAGGGPPG